VRRETKNLKCPVTAWIALSAYGYPAYFLGYYRTRAELVRAYTDLYGGAFKDAGYQPTKVRITKA